MKILISIAAGVRISLFRKHLKTSLIARVMPNTPAIVGEGASAVYFDGNFTDQQKDIVLKIFKTCGIAEVVKIEDLLDAVTGLSGSGPAYVYTFINALTDGGVKEGLTRETSKRLAIQTVLGAAKLAQNEMGTHLLELRDRVTSPGGTTAAGNHALEEGGFNASVVNAVSAASNRSRILGGEK